ncbi:DUF4174 domain-containing protein [Planktomarina sp.]|jgi:hypothetical protein|nr:DUF4174 domain-containing protein [Planktomarina sp.]
MLKKVFHLWLGLLAIAPPVLAGEALNIWRSDPAHIFDASEVELSDVIWVARPWVVFADSPLDPTFTQQMALLQAKIAVLQERDVMIVVDTDPKAKSTLRRTLHPKGFNWVLIGKDGNIKLRKPFAWDMRELSRVIDKMPIRQREMRKP